MDNTKIINQLLEYGLNLEDLVNLSIEQAILYFRFCEEKKHGKSSIHFAGFTKEETLNLTSIANKCDLDVKSKISDKLTFYCAPASIETNIIEQVKKYESIKWSLSGFQLTKEDFELFFKNELIGNFDFLYDKKVPLEYQIATPLSNFDNDKKIKSFSFDSDDIYTVNLFSMTCTCMDFYKSNRINYSKGDLRRMCKHLRAEYINSFGLHGLSPFKKSIIVNAPHLRDFKLITIEDFQSPIIILYNTDNEWWEIFVPNKSGKYKEYSYSCLEERFSYENKPHGIVRILKAKFKEVYNEIKSLDAVLEDFEIFVRKTYNELWKLFKNGHCSSFFFDTELSKRIYDEANRIESIYKSEFGDAKIESKLQRIILKVINVEHFQKNRDKYREGVRPNSKHSIDKRFVQGKYVEASQRNSNPQGCVASVVLFLGVVILISCIIDFIFSK